jgi:hypothetical protein
MLTMTEPQVWTMMGVFTALFIGTLTLISTLFVRVVRSEIGRLEGRFEGRFQAIESRFDAVDARFDAVDARFDTVNARIDSLDRDVQALVKRTFGLDRD